ncbi:MAG TPA: plastocyanin/azurin family copper-binding protein [Nitrosopumilaceae archaeon]|nr:plastocyanin/azurin family copper-binding protein [Nitrosopumilaceae archaeon]
MSKIKISIAIITGIILVAIAILFQTDNSEFKEEKPSIKVEPDVIMPTKVSRPGCERTNSCYVPSLITVKKGQQVTWSNEDVAFHSVTSGFYGEPNLLFNSGYLDPGQQFSFTFDDGGKFDYFCTLHPWMKGQVIVE